MTGCEEAGLLGARAFLDSRDTPDWLFLNFDGVGAPATLHYLTREGVGPQHGRRSRPAAVAERAAESAPSSGSSRQDAPRA